MEEEQNTWNYEDDEEVFSSHPPRITAQEAADRSDAYGVDLYTYDPFGKLVLRDNINLQNPLPAPEPHFYVSLRYENNTNTTVMTGIPRNLDFVKMIRLIKTDLHCKAWYQHSQKRDGGITIYVSSDHRETLRSFLTHWGISAPENITVY